MTALRNLGDVLFVLIMSGMLLALILMPVFYISMVTTSNEERTITEEIPLGSVTYDHGMFHVTYIQGGEFRSDSFTSCSVGDRDVLVDAVTTKRSWAGEWWSQDSDSLTLTNDTLARIGAIA